MKKNMIDLFMRESMIILAVLAIFMMSPFYAHAVEISNVPLDAQLNSAPANFMILVDDSGSMDWEIMTKETDGLFEINNVQYTYIFDDTANYNLYKTGGYSGKLTGDNRLYWKSQWSGYNFLYYNPSVTYKKWYNYKKSDGTLGSDADPSALLSHPHYDGAGINLSGNFAPIPIPATYDFEIDDMDSSKTLITGTWTIASGARHLTTVSGSVFKWLPDFPSTGKYDVQVYIRDYSNYDQKATYRVYSSAGLSDPILVNQKNTGGAWISLGEFDFAKGTGGYVTVARVSGTSTPSTYTLADNIRFIAKQPPVSMGNIPNAHYYLYSETDHIPYLVTLSSTAINYYKITNVDNNGKIQPNGVESVSYASLPNDLKEVTIDGVPSKGPAAVADSRGAAAELQNFANWYQFYRRRMFTATSAISEIVPQLKGLNVGIFSINKFIHLGVVPVEINGENRSQEILDAIQFHRQDEHGQASTPLRKGLEIIGQYYNKDDKDNNNTDLLGPSPIQDNANGGNCQQNFVMLFSDGADNGGDPGVGDIDAGMGVPYQDDPKIPANRILPVPDKNDKTQANTLADVAMYYYKTDLAKDVNNNVPTGGIDDNNIQHMVTYSVGFGVSGTLDPEDYNPSNDKYPEPYNIYAINETDRIYPNWPSYASNDADTAARIDDMWHAAVNGRGKFMSAKSPEQLLAAFNEIVADVKKRTSSAASVAINGQEYTSTSAVYQSTYETRDWNGDVWASLLSPEGKSPYFLWKANEKLEEQDWNTGRKIVTYAAADNGYWEFKGVPFRYDKLSNALKAKLNADPVKAQKLLNYIRGDETHEAGSGISGGEDLFRRRGVRNDSGQVIRHSKLGDIVHSAPVFHNGIVYVGANDGMLHAFKATGEMVDKMENGVVVKDPKGNPVKIGAPDEGKEVFAYVPSLIYDNFEKFSSSEEFEHRYFVDMTPFVKSISNSQTLLVGALGQGGKGIYCLDITSVPDMVASTSEDNVAKVVKWEFPEDSQLNIDPDPDMGSTFSRPYIVKTHVLDNSGKPKWAVIFGNGYNSTTQHAVLYVVDALTGEEMVRIDVNNKLKDDEKIDNGLSMVNPVDVDADGVVDYVYAGDLKGNLWKFNIKDKDSTKWGVAYKTAMFTAIGPSESVQPITARPDVMLHCDSKMPGYIVIFGTGKFLGKGDIENKDVQTIYGIWDYGDDDTTDDTEYVGKFERGTTRLLEQTQVYFNSATTKVIKITVDANGNEIRTEEDAVQPSIVRVLSDNAINWLTKEDEDKNSDGTSQMPNPDLVGDLSVDASYLGWYFDLPNEGERVYQDVTIRSGGALVISSTPKPSATEFCQTSGESIFHELEACGGGRTKNGHLDIKADAKIDSQDLVKIQVDGKDEYVSASGVFYPNLVYPPVIMNAGDGTEIKIFSTATAEIATLREKGEKQGIYYWRSY